MTKQSSGSRDPRGLIKKAGQQAAKTWIQGAPIQHQIDLAGCDFQYGDTLDDLVEEGFVLPDSTDQIFSWGFYKQVKSFVHHCVYMQKHAK